MKVHSDIIIFEILNLYFEFTNEKEIDIEKLKKSFYVLIDIINKKNSLNINFDFNSELKKFLDKFSDHIEENNDTITLISDLSELFNALIDSYESLTLIDSDCQNYVFDRRVYDALSIRIPIDEMQEYFDLNKKIIKAYLRLGENEHNGIFDELDINHLKLLLETLHEILNESDNSTLIKLKMCYSYFNDNLLPNTNEKHINSAWNTILFSLSPKELYALSYNRLEFLVTMIDKETDEEREEILNDIFNTLKETEKLSEISYFITILLIELNNYLKKNPNSIAKEALLIKKYLLISIPELLHIEKYFLDNSTINNYPTPEIPEELCLDSFENLKNKVLDCVNNLVQTNKALEKPHILGITIVSALFIKVFIENSINPDSISDIIDLIENSVFYKQKGYEDVTLLVDDIIFNSPDLKR
ncbi:MAG: hypothetical protein HFI49_03630 [Bacilli bacterium]|jgi:hypothetical protein|nr:hypothetical protein [Bacilli bacterium]